MVSAIGGAVPAPVMAPEYHAWSNRRVAEIPPIGGDLRNAGSQTESLHHITLSAGDLSRALAFYDATLAPLGLTRSAEYSDEEEDAATMPLEAVGYGTPAGEPQLWLVAAAARTSVTSGAHVAFVASSRHAVDECYRAARETGARLRQPPRRWEIYRPGYYGTLVEDPDGNLLEAFVAE